MKWRHWLVVVCALGSAGAQADSPLQRLAALAQAQAVVSGNAVWTGLRTPLTAYVEKGITPLGPYEWVQVQERTGRVALCWRDECLSWLPQEGYVLRDRWQWAEGSLPRLPTDLAALALHYELRALPEMVFEGRAREGVRFEAKDGWRFSQEWWWDRETRAVVRRTYYNADAQVIEEFVLTNVSAATQLDFPEVRRHWAVLMRQPQVDMRPQPPREPAPWRFSEAIPGGFVVAAVAQRSGPRGAVVWQWRLSDGLAQVSVFAERLDEAADRGGDVEPQAVGATHVVTVRGEGWRRTAVGDVPEAALRAILAAMQRKEAR